MKKVTTFTLKIIAIVAMLIDHYAAIFLNEDTTEYGILRGIGRLAFPLFIFMLIQGFFLTKSRSAYLKRLLMLAVLSEPFYDLAFGYTFNYQNIFFTLSLGFGNIYLIELLYNSKAKAYAGTIGVISTALFFILGCLIGVDYFGVGVLAITTGYAVYRYFKISKNKPKLAEIGAFTVSVITLALLDVTELYGLILIPIVWLYNGEKGKNTRWFYFAYPVHLLVYYLGSILV